jgi:hypothetical protein
MRAISSTGQASAWSSTLQFSIMDVEDDASSSEGIGTLLAEVPALLRPYVLAEVRSPRPVVEEKKGEPVTMTVAECPADQGESISAEFAPGNIEMPGIHPAQDGSPAIDTLIDVIVADLLMDERA